MKRFAFCTAIIVSGVLLAPTQGRAAPMGTAFTYQAQLKNAGVPVNDTCDFRFTLWSDPVSVLAVDQVGPTLTFDGGIPNPPPIMVANGLFQVGLDFGSGAINGQARWLEIEVCCSSPCAPGFATLMPRQELTPTPNALALPGLWTEENAGTPNLIGGFNANLVTPGVVGATIGGGGAADDGFGNPVPNRITDDFGTIAGGRNNRAGDGLGTTVDADFAAVGGGSSNKASDDFPPSAGAC